MGGAVRGDWRAGGARCGPRTGSALLQISAARIAICPALSMAAAGSALGPGARRGLLSWLSPDHLGAPSSSSSSSLSHLSRVVLSAVGGHWPGSSSRHHNQAPWILTFEEGIGSGWAQFTLPKHKIG